MTCPNGCDLEEFGGTHQGPPDCGLQPSDPDYDERRRGLTDEQKFILIKVWGLLEKATCNSLDPAARRRWSDDRDHAIVQLREMTGQ
jgi:hypothetical protein